MRPVSYYSLVFLEDPLRGERLNVGVVGWCDADNTLRWKFLEDLSHLGALHMGSAVINAFANLFTRIVGAEKASLLVAIEEPRGPQSWLGYTKKCASFQPADVLVADIFRMLLDRPIETSERVLETSSPESETPPHAI